MFSCLCACISVVVRVYVDVRVYACEPVFCVLCACARVCTLCVCAVGGVFSVVCLCGGCI